MQLDFVDVVINENTAAMRLCGNSKGLGRVIQLVLCNLTIWWNSGRRCHGDTVFIGRIWVFHKENR